MSGEKLFEIVKNMINKFFRFEEFCGLPDTPENRAKFISNVPLGRLC